MDQKYDRVNHPKHYTSSKTGVEVIEITSFLGFDLGNAFKYLARYRTKENPSEDVEKAAWYMDRYAADCPKMDWVSVSSDATRLEIEKKIQKYIDVEEIVCIKAAMMSILQAVHAEGDYGQEAFTGSVSLLEPDTYKQVIENLRSYAKTISGKKPEDLL